MRRLNIKFIIVLFVIVAIIGIGGWVFWAVNAGQGSQRLLEKARLAQESGQFDEALRFYARYLNHNPNDTESLCEAAMMTLLGVSFGDAANDEMELWGRIQRSQRFIEDVARATFATVLAQAAARSKP